MWQIVHITQRMHMHTIIHVHSLSELLIKLIFVRKSGANGQSHCDGEVGNARKRMMRRSADGLLSSLLNTERTALEQIVVESA